MIAVKAINFALIQATAWEALFFLPNFKKKIMDASTNSLNWFEIPVVDMPRAKHFYQVVFGIHMHDDASHGMEMAFFPFEMGSGKLSGALVKSPMHIPASQGVVIYLNGNPDLSDALGRVTEVGGEILMGKTQISAEIGYMAFFRDSEGNRIGLHSGQ